MIIETRESAGIAVLVLKGSFESPQDLEAFSSEMERQVAAGKNQVLIDLHLLAYLNSNAVGRLVKYKKRLQEAGGDLALLQPTKSVREVLELLQLQQILKPWAEESEALAALQGKAPSGTAAHGASTAPAASSAPAPASVPPAQGVPAAPVEVLYRLTATGAEGAGTLLDAERTRVRFRCADPAVLAPGAAVELRLRIPRFRKPAYLDVSGTVSVAEVAGADGVRVTVEFPGLSDDERRDLEQYVADLGPARG